MELEFIKGRIESGRFHDFCSDSDGWGGADVIITDRHIQNTSDTVVMTQHYQALSWLFCELRNCFSSLLDWNNKYEFYGLLADAAKQYHVNMAHAKSIDIRTSQACNSAGKLVYPSPYSRRQSLYINQCSTCDGDTPEGMLFAVIKEAEKILRNMGNKERL